MFRILSIVLLTLAATAQADTQRGIALFKDKDYAAAKREFLKSDSVNDPVAIRYYAYMLYTGTGGDFDQPRAKALLYKAYNAGDTASGSYLAGLLARVMSRRIFREDYTPEDFDTLAEAMVLFEDTYSGKSNQEHATNVAKIFKVTDGKVAPKGDMITWLKRATAEGDQYSAWDLAGAYSAANGVKKDDAAAFHWAELAAFLGHSEARGAVGSIYVSGAIGPKKPDQGIALIARGAEDRDNASMLLLAEYYESLGEPRDLGMAWRVLDIARARGLKESNRSKQLADRLSMEGARIDGRNISDAQYNQRIDDLLRYTLDDYNAAIRNFKTRYTPFKD